MYTAYWHVCRGWVISTSSVTTSRTFSVVRLEEKTARGVARMRQPLLIDLGQKLMADCFAILALGSCTVVRGNRAECVVLPMS